MHDDGQVPESFGFGRLFWSTSEAIVAADLATERIVLWNPAAKELFGYTAEEAVGMPLERLVPEEMKEQHLAGIRRYSTTGEASIVGSMSVELPALTRSGERREIELSLTDMSDDAMHCVIAVIRDVTDQRRSERELARVNQAMRDFVAVASHDLRTPLATIVGNAGVLEGSSDLLTPEERLEALQAISRSGRHAIRLVNDLLTLSQIQAGVLPASGIPVDVGVAAAAAAKAVGVQAALPAAGTVSVKVDPDHLERMVVNLLSNAARYGAPPLRVSAHLDTASGTVAISVDDSGSGVPEELRPQLFAPYMPGRKRRADSTGLGLSIVRGLAEANAGSVSYADAPGGGARFTITLPHAPS